MALKRIRVKDQAGMDKAVNSFRRGRVVVTVRSKDHIEISNYSNMVEIVILGETKVSIRNNVIITARDSAVVNCYGTSYVTACDLSTINAYDDSQVRLSEDMKNFSTIYSYSSRVALPTLNYRVRNTVKIIDGSLKVFSGLGE